MADITMCMNEDCPSKQSCYRYTAIPNEHRQSYADFMPDLLEGKCENYWPIVAMTKGKRFIRQVNENQSGKGQK
ncbi:hypothetical protein EBT16_09875 [bacterium]|nr:hypothetical protein [bacterium]